MPRKSFLVLIVGWSLALLPTASQVALAGPGGQLTIEVVDADTHQPLACRMHLTNATKRTLKAPKVPFWHDHFVFSGQITLKLGKGDYDFVIERGPEYLVRTGHFTMEDLSKDTQTVDLKRFADMAAEGWWSGDLDVERPARDLELLMQAEDLHVVELLSWPGRSALVGKANPAKQPLVNFDSNYYYHLSAGSDARAGGRLLFFNLDEPLDLAGAKPEFPPSVDSITAARKSSQAWIDAAQAYSWDLPVWVALGGLDSVQLANRGLARKSSVQDEGNGKPRETRYFPGPTGNGRWSERIYYHLLNCGLHVTPTAGSGSGVAHNPLGYNRMYVHVDGPLTYEKWWEAARVGRVVVTNGPLIRPNVEGEMPGHVFRANSGEEIELEVGLTLSTRDRVAYLEIIKDGQLAHQVRLDDWKQSGGKLPLLHFTESGWFVIRAVTDVRETYRFATTAPYYVEIGDRPRISKESAQFFLDWVDEREANLKLPEGKQRDEVLQHQRQARQFWQDMVNRANVD